MSSRSGSSRITLVRGSSTATSTGTWNSKSPNSFVFRLPVNPFLFQRFRCGLCGGCARGSFGGFPEWYVQAHACKELSLRRIPPSLAQWDTLCPAYEQFAGINGASKVGNVGSKAKDHPHA